MMVAQAAEWTLDEPTASALERGREALELSRSHNTPPTLKVYGVWYAYQSGEFTALNRAIDGLIERSGRVDEYTLEQLFDQHLSIASETSARSAKQSRRLEVDKVVGLVSNLSGCTESYTDALRVLQAETGADLSQDRLKETLAGLVFEGERVQALTASLVDEVKTLKQQYETLNMTLDRVYQDSIEDSLTGVLNRRGLDERLNQHFNQRRRADDVKALCVVLCDVDHFKSINDRYGHPSGDTILRGVAALLKANTSGDSFVGRYGGEEFAIVLPEFSRLEAHNWAVRVRQRIEDTAFIIEDGAVRIEALTASFGVASAEDCSSVGELLCQADKAMYRAKRSGRNTVRTIGFAD